MNRVDLPFEAGLYPEYSAGLYSRKDCTVAFYHRIAALIEAEHTVLNLGAGRGANIIQDASEYRRRVQRLKGRARQVIGIDPDPAVLSNPDLDVAHVVPVGVAWPIADESVDLIVSDHVLEHVEDPEALVREVKRVLRPGGWFCARTPSKWGYIGMGARIVPNRLHPTILRRLQSRRREEDIFPTVYRMNTLRTLRGQFRESDWSHHSYGHNGVPGYHGGSRVLFRLIDAWGWLMPPGAAAKLHVFLRKQVQG